MDGAAMTVKNYLVKSLYEVRDPNWLVHDRSHEPDLYRRYLDMHRVSVGSFKQHLQGAWELRFFSGQVNSISEAFEHTFWHIHDLWHAEPCNIFYTDPDTVARLSINPWQLSGFRMFNFTDPRSFQNSNVYQLQFPWFFNAGVRYFSHDMQPSVWQKGVELARRWDHTTYDTEQIILNAMLWSQGLRLDQTLMPRLAYQAMSLDRAPVWQHDIWNGCSMTQAAVIHVHGSRNAQDRLGLMQQLAGGSQT